MRRSIESVEVPETFYVRVDWAPKDIHLSAARRVLAESGPHFKRDWITLGFVSKQSPRGQGVFMGFPREWLRPASKKEILRALTQDHLHGSNFRPDFHDVTALGFHLVANESIQDQIHDNMFENRVVDISQQQLRDERERLLKERARIMAEWSSICECQAEAIRSAVAALA